MKRFLFVIVLLVAAAGCDRETCAQCEETVTLHRVTVAVLCPDVQTKRGDSSAADEEDLIGRCLLYIFNPSGAFVGRYDSFDGRFDFYLPGETYDFVAVVNKADLPQAPASRDALLAATTPLAENVPGRFVMVGTLDGLRVSGDEALSLAVSRVVAKVSYAFRTAFTGSLAQESFDVQDFYLANVAGETDLTLSGSAPAASGIWYRRLGPADASGTVFYVCPNDAPDLHERDGWSPRCTRFVLKAALAGRTFYYPVTLDTIRPNTHYHVDLTIAGYGLEHPEDDPKSYGAIRAEVTVAGWEDGGDFIGDF